MPQDGEETVKDLQSKYCSSNVHFMYVDIASKTNFEEAFLNCLEIFGSSVDVVVNNAGINGEINWESMININLKVTLFTVYL